LCFQEILDGSLLLFFFLNTQSSFGRAKSWVKELQTQGTAKMVIALAGNKSDLEENRRVKKEEASAYAEDNGILF